MGHARSVDRGRPFGPDARRRPPTIGLDREPAEGETPTQDRRPLPVPVLASATRPRTGRALAGAEQRMNKPSESARFRVDEAQEAAILRGPIRDDLLRDEV